MEISHKVHNAFISYSRKDGVDFVNELVQKLADDIDGRQLKLWKDRERIEGDKNWWKQIVEAIDQSEYIILILTPKALESGICQKEWSYARQAGVCVRPVKGVPDKDINYDLLPASMRNVHIYDIKEEWRRFVNDICRSCEAKKLPFMAPPVPQDYVERKEIFESAKQILLTSKDNRRLALSTALKGAGGFGKTTLATALCHDEDILDKFPDGILWATIGEDANLLKEISKIHYALTGKRGNFEDEKEGSIVLAQELKQGSYLLVLDDVWKYSSIKELTERIQFTTILITTRIDSVALQANATTCKVNEMKRMEGYKLLAGEWNLTEEQKAIVFNLVNDAGEWPIILKLMRRAALSRIESGEAIGKTLVYLKEKYGRSGLQAFDIRDATTRNEAVSRCIEASLSFLQPAEKIKCIHLGIFPTDTQIPIDTVCQLWKVDEFEGEELLQLLDDFALVEVDLGKQVVQFHDILLHFYALSLRETLADINELLLNGWHNIYELPNGYAWQFYIWHHVKAGQFQKAASILSDYNWIKAKLNATGIHSLLLDLDLLEEKTGFLDLLYKALRMSAHVLVKDKTQLAIQLHERLKPFFNETPELFLSSLKDELDISVFFPVKCAFQPIGILRYTLQLGSEPKCIIQHHGKVIVGLAHGDIMVLNSKSGELIHQLFGHKSAITCLGVSGKNLLVSGSTDMTLRSWDLQSGELVHVFAGQRDVISCLAISNNILVSGSYNRILRTWDLDSGKLLGEFTGHSDIIKCLTIYNGNIVISTSTMKSNDLHTPNFMAWDINTGETLQQFTGHTSSINSIVIYKDILIGASSGSTIVNEDENEKKVERNLFAWNIKSGELLYEFVPDKREITSLAIAGNVLIGGHWNKNLLSWDIVTGKLLHEFVGHNYPVSFLCASGNVMATASDNNKSILLWDLDAGKMLNVLIGHTKLISCLSLSKNILFSGSSDKTLCSWDLQLCERQEALVEKQGTTEYVGMSETFLVTARANKDFSCWDLRSGKLMYELPYNFSPRSSVLSGNKMICGEVGTIFIGDLYSGMMVKKILTNSTATITQLCVHDKILVCGDSNARIISIDIESGKTLNQFEGLKDFITCLTISDNILFGSCMSFTDDKRNLLLCWNLESGKLIHSFAVIQKKVINLTVVQNLLVSHHYDNTIYTWDIKSGNLLNKFTDLASLQRVVIIHKELIISGHWDKTIRTWDLLSGKLNATLTGHTKEINCFAAINEYLISASNDYTIRIWNLDTGSLVSCIYIDEPAVNLVIDKEGTRLIAFGQNGNLYFFKLRL